LHCINTPLHIYPAKDSSRQGNCLALVSRRQLRPLSPVVNLEIIHMMVCMLFTRAVLQVKML
jgi:hypothetical protein